MWSGQMRMSVLLLLLSYCSAQAASTSDSIKQELHSDWQMVLTNCPGTFKALTDQKFNVSVPSTMHLNLEKHNQIPNPFFG